MNLNLRSTSSLGIPSEKHDEQDKKHPEYNKQLVSMSLGGHKQIADRENKAQTTRHAILPQTAVLRPDCAAILGTHKPRRLWMDWSTWNIKRACPLPQIACDAVPRNFPVSPTCAAPPHSLARFRDHLLPDPAHAHYGRPACNMSFVGNCLL